MATATSTSDTSTTTAGTDPTSRDERASVGTAILLRFMLRRDRVKLPAWTGGVALFWLYYTRLVPSVYDDLDDVVGLVEGPMGRLYTGPGYGFDELGYDRFITGGYGMYVLLLVGLMSILLVVRHTRLEEQTGRAELVRANVVGRHAPLTATFLLAVLTNAVVAAAVAAVMVTSPHMDAPGSLLFAAGVFAVGLVFASFAAVAAQVTEFSRTAAGLAGASLGAAFIIRALGDMVREHGSPLSWLSPLAWSQQTAPFVLDRWWPLLISVATATGATALAYALSARRDVGASMFAVRPGPDRAPDWLGSPLTLALRLQRASLIGWTVSLTVAGVLFGAWTDAMLTSLDDLPDALIDLVGGAEDVVGGYLAVMALFMALIVGIFAVLAVQSLRGEETTGRGEPVLATPVSRWEWMGAHVGVAAIGVVIVLAATGLGTGLGAAIVTRDAGYLWDTTVAHLAHVPAVLLVLGIAALLFGVAPRLIGLTWAILGYGLVVGIFGAITDLPDWSYSLSPFEHVSRFPLDPLAVAPLVVLSLMAAGSIAVGLIAFRRRGVNVA
jgi:ABC-2 type transport system permease protein